MRRPPFVGALVTAALGAAGAGCGGGTGETDGVQVLFEVPRDGRPPSAFYALPFPNDLRARDDGTLDLADHPRPNQLIERYVDTIAMQAGGFGTNAAAFVRFSAAIDPASLPATAAATLEDGASVYLVDVDPGSPERGARRPLRFRFEPRPGETIGANWLSCLPFPGFPLRGTTTYALVVTTRVRGGDGAPVRPAPDLAALLGDGGDAAVTRAREVYRPLLEWLDGPGGDERDDVAGAAVFTTQDPTALMARLRQVIVRPCAGASFPACVPPPVARDVARAELTGDYALYTGVYDGPNFQTGEPPYTAGGGEILVDPVTGDPVPQRMETLRFAVAVPPGTPPPAGWPIVLYAHGTGGDYRSFVADGTAAQLAGRGLAVISIDQVLHGPRAPSGSDPGLAFFNFENPIAGRDNVRQGALDDFQLVRLAATLTITDGATTHRFDPERMSFMGHSQGGLTGPPFLAFEPRIRGAVLSGAGGLVYLSLLHKTQPHDIAALVANIIRDQPLDEFNPLLALIQTLIEPSDPVNYAPLLVREPPPGVPAKDVYQSEGLVDHYTPLPSIEGLAVAIGGSLAEPVLKPVEGLALRGRAPLVPPVTGNLGGRTVVLTQYAAPSGKDGHFVVFDVPAAERQHAEFLGTLAANGTATLVAP